MARRHKKQGVLRKAQWLGLLVFVFCALGHRFIANDAYLIAKTENGIQFFTNKNVEWGIRAPIPYSSSGLDKNNRNKSPLEMQEVNSLYYRHWLGTDDLGRDVLAGLLRGSFIALQVGVLSLLFSIILGIILSYFSGYFGDTGIRIEKRWLLPALIVTGVLIFYTIYSNTLVVTLCLLIALAFMWYYLATRKDAQPVRTVGLPLDMLIQRMIDIMDSIPGLFLILIILSLFRTPSLMNVILVIALMRWPVITRHLRAEILKIKQEDYIRSARSTGQKDLVIFLRHVLPVAISPIMIVAAFGFATAVLTESTLSFLGIGIPLDEVSWGSLIKQARFDFRAWWLAVFPGLAIYAVVLLFNSIGESLNSKLRGLSG